MQAALMSDDASLTWQSCITLSHLSAEEFAALETSNGCSDEIVAQMAHYLIKTADGRLSIRASIGADIAQAVGAGDLRRSGALRSVVLRFMQLYTQPIS